MKLEYRNRGNPQIHVQSGVVDQIPAVQMHKDQTSHNLSPAEFADPVRQDAMAFAKMMNEKCDHWYFQGTFIPTPPKGVLIK